MSDAQHHKRKKLLGMNPGTAAHRLRKMILWKFVVQTGVNICYRCGKEITSIDELSIDHKRSWLLSETPLETFFDLDNIAFSHLSCNCSVGEHDPTERINKRIHSDGMVLCHECGEYLSPDKFSLRPEGDMAGRHVPYRPHCKKCRVIRKTRGDSY